MGQTVCKNTDKTEYWILIFRLMTQHPFKSQHLSNLSQFNQIFYDEATAHSICKWQPNIPPCLLKCCPHCNSCSGSTTNKKCFCSILDMNKERIILELNSLAPTIFWIVISKTI